MTVRVLGSKVWISQVSEVEMIFRDSQEAFEDAIADGELSEDEGADNWAGNYMYMFTDDEGTDQFKNIRTRVYLN